MSNSTETTKNISNDIISNENSNIEDSNNEDSNNETIKNVKAVVQQHDSSANNASLETAPKTQPELDFASLGLSANILKAVAEQGYTSPTPIQQAAVPAVIAGKDLMAAAQTGTGKTAGFTLPILQNLSKQNPAKNLTGRKQKSSNQVRALILTPTRELAAQVAENVALYGKYLSLKSTVVFGGVKINPQMQRLRGGTDILVATPGRLLDLYQQNAIRFDELEVLVLDEADRMLDMGFIHDIKKIIRLLPKERQNLLFSATFSGEIRELAKGLINNPVEISVTPENSTVERIDQLIYPVDKSRKTALLIKLIKEHNWYQVLVFSRTKHGANRLAQKLEKANIRAAAIHGNKSQGARTRALAEFKNNDVQVLVATDIAARGIDIDLLPHVVNFDLPNVPEDYVHRIGRTGRAGSAGQAVSLVSADELKELKSIERLTKQVIDREIIKGFEPTKKLPITTLDTRPIRKRPKKNKPRNPNQDKQTNQANKKATTEGRSTRQRPTRRRARSQNKVAK